MVREKALLEFIADIMDVDASTISLDTAYGSIPEWDSLMQLQLISELEDEFGIDIPMNSSIRTLGDFYSIIAKKRGMN